MECERAFGTARPLDRLKVIARATVPVARADACLLLAELATPDSLRGTGLARPRGSAHPRRPLPASGPHRPPAPARPGG